MPDREIFFFNEYAYSAYPQDVAEELGYSAYLFPNKYFDPKIAYELYHMYYEEQQFATETGFDGLMINEHHYNPQTLNPVCNISGTALAKFTKKGKIALVGNILPVNDNPVRLAEEIAMMDVISGGRVISGFVRGVGYESLAMNANPVYNRERFEEAHDLIIKAWTTPGPFRWEGKHYHYRAVNPWVLPYQQPHPPIWVPGGASPETVVWAAKHKYTYLALGTPVEYIPEMWEGYWDTAKEIGYEPVADNFGYVAQVLAADTDEEAYELGRNFFWQLGSTFSKVPSHWLRPPGYMTRAAIKNLAHTAKRSFVNLSYETAQERGQIITGTPKTVIAKLKQLIDVVDPGNLVLWAREGPMAHKDAMRCLELLGTEVIPEIKEYKANEDNSWRAILASKRSKG